MTAPPFASPRSRPVRVALLAVLLACTVLLSLLWWRTDADLCVCEHCPDGYCIYATQIHALLRGATPDPVARLIEEGRAYLHAHSPLAPALVALLLLAGLAPVPAFALLNVGATLLCWRSVRRTVERSWTLPAVIVLQLAVAFFANPIVIRSMARPVTDAVGMLCVVWSLAALDAHLAARDGRSAARLFVLQVAGLASRVSFIPMLGMPALAELAEPGPWRERIRRAVRAGIVLGALPALLFFGTLRLLGLEHVHDAWVWAHQPEFVSKAPLLDFAGSATLAGAAYLALGLLPLGERRDVRAWRLHLAWAVLYLAFLASGRGALWPRYFLPVVPSLLIVATPALCALERRSRRVAWAVVLLCSLVGLHALRRVGHPLESLVLLAGSARGAVLEHGAPGRVRLAVDRAAMSATGSVAAANAPLVLDGRPDTAWSTGGPLAAGTSLTLDLGRPRRIAALVLETDGSAALGGLVVDGTLDGETWTRVPVAFRRRGFFAERPRLELRWRDRGTWRGVRITATAARPVPWVVSEVEVRVARGGGRESSRTAP